VNPEPFTLRELLWMAEAVQREHWQHTSCILALIANVNRDPRKGRAFRPADFDPFAATARDGIPLTTDNWADLKALVKKGRRET